eukprot:3941203-Rhodomonas_salina.4
MMQRTNKTLCDLLPARDPATRRQEHAAISGNELRCKQGFLRPYPGSSQGTCKQISMTAKIAEGRCFLRNSNFATNAVRTYTYEIPRKLPCNFRPPPPPKSTTKTRPPG